MAKKKAARKKTTKKKAAKKVKVVTRTKGRKTVMETLTRRAAVRRLVIQGHPIPWIVEVMGVHPRVVTADMEDVYKTWHERAAMDWGAHVAENLGRIEEVEREAWDAWLSSRKPSLKEERHFYQLDVQDQTAEVTEVYDLKKKIEHRDGNPAFLTVMLKCVAERSKLLGLDKREDEESFVDDVQIVGVIVSSREDVKTMQTVTELLSDNQPLLEGTVLASREREPNDDPTSDKQKPKKASQNNGKHGKRNGKPKGGGSNGHV